MKLSIYIPKIEDYWYEKELLENPKTMIYNAGYDVNYDGYHYDTGVIDYPKEKWLESFNKRVKNKIFYAFIKDEENEKFIGDVNYHYNKSNNYYECGILIEDKYRGLGYSKPALKLLIEEARKNGIKELYDDFESSRVSAMKTFKNCGFKEVKKINITRFNRPDEIVILCKKIED
jgi:RimJ/RimL family protein N-acetyltransferase